jgi:methylmalonyl-CoA mutase N-terminal domain/subunit
LRTQQILQSETGVTQTVDPLGGSYFLEALTNRMENAVSGILAEIDSMGGIVKAVENGWIHSEISAAAYQYQTRVESGEMPVVGVNCFQIEDEKLPIELFRLPETLNIQKAKLERIRKQRDSVQVQKVMDTLARGCEKGQNLMELLVDGVKVFVTQGEISQTLKSVYGVWNPPLF